jgi:hypothetical protein
VVLRGHAIEARISAEDPFNRFLPASGTLAALRNPEGPGVRNDSGLYDGMQVPLHYDPLLAKLICWGEDREQALARMRRAVDEYVISGVRTTLPFVAWLLRHPRFAAGDFSTDFIAQEWRPTATPGPSPTGRGETSYSSQPNPTPGPSPAGEGEIGGLAPTSARGGGMPGADVVAALGAALAAQDEGAATAARRRSQNGATADGSRWKSEGRRAALHGER